MGCGGSKLEPDQEARLRPILRRRLEEFMAKRNAGASKKPLLAGDGTASRDSDAREEEDNTLLPKEEIMALPPITSDDGHPCLLTQDCPPTPQIMTPIVVDNTNDSSISSPNVENDNNVDSFNNENNVDEKKIENNNKDDVNEEKSLVGIQVSKGSSQEQEEECTCDELDRLELSPGSPSFRVYCVQSLDEEELHDITGNLDLDECIDEDEKQCLRQESSNSNKEMAAVKLASKKRKRGRKFKMMTIPKGGKNILHNMHSFYNFPCNSHNSHLVQQAAA